MKKLLTLIILSSVTSLAFSQERFSGSKSIDDNGSDFSIQVNGAVHGKRIHYAYTFSVQGLSKSERNALADRILDSLGVGKIESPTAPLPPVEPIAPGFGPAPQQAEVSGLPHYGTTVTRNDADKGGFVASDDRPYTKEIHYDDESGLLYLRYQFFRSREEFIYEKTAHAADKSESEKLEMIRAFEKEIELPTAM
jgi:hypothetical protein